MIEQIFILSLITFAFWWFYQEGEIFGFVQKQLDGIPAKLKKPLYECAVCMHWWYGSLFYWLLFGHSFKEDWKQWLIVVVAGTGLNAIIIKLWPPECYEYEETRSSL